MGFIKNSIVDFVREFERSVFPVMIDPSVLCSPRHVYALIESRYEIYVPATLFYLIGRGEIERFQYVMSYFYWPWHKRFVKFDFEAIRFLVLKIAKPYEAKREFITDVTPYFERIRVPPEVLEILLQEFSFLKEHSSLLMRTKRTLSYFKRAGFVIIDAANRLKDYKRRVFYRLRGLTWFVVTLLSVGAFVFREPWLGCLGGIFLLVADG